MVSQSLESGVWLRRLWPWHSQTQPQRLVGRQRMCLETVQNVALGLKELETELVLWEATGGINKILRGLQRRAVKANMDWLFTANSMREPNVLGIVGIAPMSSLHICVLGPARSR